jgi:hypothetical protein
MVHDHRIRGLLRMELELLGKFHTDSLRAE